MLLSKLTYPLLYSLKPEKTTVDPVVYQGLVSSRRILMLPVIALGVESYSFGTTLSRQVRG
jgi:hypothetical protein